MKSYFIGKIDEKNPISAEAERELSNQERTAEIAKLERKESINKDFEQLRQTAIKMVSTSSYKS
jgi:vacuolar-type H+-ATPase subunit E/Vma4